MRTLHLTSPLMHGTDVEHAQRLLAANVFKQNYQPGRADGQFGEATARACARAHYWVGDVVSQPVFGERLEGFLSGKTKLPAENAKRRTARLTAAKRKPLRAKALAALTGKLGVKERPSGSNRCWATDWYGLVGPWCAMSVSWAYATSGSVAFVKGHAYAYVPFIVADARMGVNNLAVTNHPEPGDLVCYDWTGDGTADHVGLFEKWVETGRRLSAIEGNTSVGNDSNGGEVMRRERNTAAVQCFVHVAR